MRDDLKIYWQKDKSNLPKNINSKNWKRGEKVASCLALNSFPRIVNGIFFSKVVSVGVGSGGCDKSYVLVVFFGKKCPVLLVNCMYGSSI
jgi:hypothetical protein